MSAVAPTTSTADWGTFGEGPQVPMSRLVKVELRKMVDTRAGLWLIGVIGLLTVAALLILLLAADTKDHTFDNAMGAAATPQGLLLPVLGILLVTQEWGQRTGMVTFTLEPHRAKVLWSKVVAALLLGLAAIVLSLVLATLATAIGGADNAFDGVTVASIGQYFLLEELGIVGGLAFGLLFLNSAIAIVVNFILPTVIALVTSLWTAIHKAQPWIDPSTAQGPLQSGEHLTGTEWAHVLTTSLIWVVVPFVLGLWRVLRAEVK